jgi:hypothetical protein
MITNKNQQQRREITQDSSIQALRDALSILVWETVIGSAVDD